MWFTETGGIVSRTNRRKVTFPESAEHAAMATRFLFDDLIPLSRRITRVYLYHWNSEPGPKTWDSGADRPDGQAAAGLSRAAARARAARRRQARRDVAGRAAAASPRFSRGARERC